jgi:hypothetical protein
MIFFAIQVLLSLLEIFGKDIKDPAKDFKCFCKIPEPEKTNVYCGYELDDPNCYPHARYYCYNGSNGMASFGARCLSTPCVPEMSVIACKNFVEFEKGKFLNFFKMV